MLLYIHDAAVGHRQIKDDLAPENDDLIQHNCEWKSFGVQDKNYKFMSSNCVIEVLQMKNILSIV